MKQHLLTLLVVFAALMCFEGSYAQSIFGAYDTACYFPKEDDPTEIDTIYGGKAYQHLGNGLRSFPPRVGETNNELAFHGLPNNIPFLTEVQTGENFNLHKLSVIKKLSYQFLDGFTWGHFRSPNITDIFYDGNAGGHPKIYWADENGDFDSARFTSIVPTAIEGGHTGGGSASFISAFATYLTSDSVNDIVMGINANGISPDFNDSIFIVLVKGGVQLVSQKAAKWDERIFWGVPDGNAGRLDTNLRYTTVGDWRGVGREDVISFTPGTGNYFYYRNDPPFILQRLVNSMHTDTLIVGSSWSLFKKLYNNGPGGGKFIAFSKKSWDHSYDLIISLPLDASTDPAAYNGICFFRGGSDFGKKRLSLDSADFFLHCPGYYSGDFGQASWPLISGAGDLTGTGNPVLLTSGHSGIGYGFLAFYVLGKAMDDKIDVFIPSHYGGGSADTIVATNKGYKSFISGSPARMSPEDQNNGIFEKGSVEILYGAEKIPVRLNPTYSETSEPINGAIEIFPNPVVRSFNMTLVLASSQSLMITLRDILGRVVFQEQRTSSGGEETLHVELPILLSGTYFLEVIGKTIRATKKISVLE